MNLENDGKKWSWEETLLAFDLYSKIEYSKISAANKDVIYLANLLGRRPGAVAKKLFNIAAHDPKQINRGIKALSHSSKFDSKIWDEFEANPEKVVYDAVSELATKENEEQQMVYENILNYDCTPSHAQTIRMRKFSENGKLTDSVIEAIMREEKPNQAEKIHIPLAQIRNYIPDSISYDDTRDYILQALKFYKKHGTKTA